jgi:hypothetical protein
MLFKEFQVAAFYELRKPLQKPKLARLDLTRDLITYKKMPN